MARRNKIAPPERHLAGAEFTNEQLVSWYRAYQPIGSYGGDLRAMCKVLEALAKERGVELPPAQGTRWPTP